MSQTQPALKPCGVFPAPTLHHFAEAVSTRREPFAQGDQAQRASRHLESKQGPRAVSRGAPPLGSDPHPATLAPSHHPSPPQGLSGYTSTGPPAPNPSWWTQKAGASRRRGGRGSWASWAMDREVSGDRKEAALLEAGAAIVHSKVATPALCPRAPGSSALRAPAGVVTGPLPSLSPSLLPLLPPPQPQVPCNLEQETPGQILPGIPLLGFC